MGIINLNLKEVEVVKASLELRRKSWANNPNLIARLEDILARINFPIIDLKPLQRATLIGCIKEYLIDPNKDLLKLSDYEILCSFDEIKDRMRKVDVGSGIINKLERKEDKKSRIFEDTIKKITILTTTKKVYFSEQDNGNIYKIGIVGEEGIGLKIDGRQPIIENFKLEKLSKDSFMNAATPREIIEKIESYGIKNSLTENQIRAKKILEKEICM